MKTCFQRSFELENVPYKEKLICKEKFRTDTKVKLVRKLRNVMRLILELWY